MLGYIKYLWTESDFCLYGKNTDRELAVLAERYQRQCGNAEVYDFECESAIMSVLCNVFRAHNRPMMIIGEWCTRISESDTRYIVNKLNPMMIRTNLYMFLTIQLCMYFMEGQERKIHWATMIKCSTMLLAGLIYWIICRNQC